MSATAQILDPLLRVGSTLLVVGGLWAAGYLLQRKRARRLNPLSVFCVAALISLVLGMVAGLTVGSAIFNALVTATLTAALLSWGARDARDDVGAQELSPTAPPEA